MILGNSTILSAIKERHVLIYPFSKHQLQSCSYDLRLGNLLYLREGSGYVLTDIETISFVLNPGQFVLGHTFEFIGSDRFAGSVGTTSTASRHGLDIHGSSAFIEPGFFNRITLEITNRSDKILRLIPYMVIATLRFEEVAGLDGSYDGNYKLAAHAHEDIDFAYEKLWKPEMMIPKRLVILKPGEKPQLSEEFGS